MVIENGFYYDIDMEELIIFEDLGKIEKEMKKIVNLNIEIEWKEVFCEEVI